MVVLLIELECTGVVSIERGEEVVEGRGNKTGSEPWLVRVAVGT